jgi:hypothetical protein
LCCRTSAGEIGGSFGSASGAVGAIEAIGAPV